MRNRTGLTRLDLIVAVACVFFILANVPVIVAAGRGRAKLEVCMANLRTLTAAWKMYANDNDGKIVNGGQAPTSMTPAGCAAMEPYWCSGCPTLTSPGYDWCTTMSSPGCTAVLTYEQRVEKLKKGAIFKYCNNTKVYRCPEAAKNMHRTYIMPESMNGYCDHCGPVGEIIKRVGQLRKSAERIVFLEEKEITVDSFIFQFTTGYLVWGPDYPSIMHGDGANFGFADGHADFREWQCQQTIDWIKRNYANPRPTYAQCPKDLDWMMNAVWGVRAVGW